MSAQGLCHRVAQIVASWDPPVCRGSGDGERKWGKNSPTTAKNGVYRDFKKIELYAFRGNNSELSQVPRKSHNLFCPVLCLHKIKWYNKVREMKKS